MAAGRGTFISLEGCEGSGKSTQAGRLCEWLSARGVTPVRTREPGGTPTGEMIRDILQHHASGEDISLTAEVLLFAASRAQHVAHVIRPALERGDWVLCDRFVDSSLAYQSGGRRIPFERVLAVNEYALDGLWPDLTLWFDLPVEEALCRMSGRDGDPDRFESEKREFHQRVAAAYRRVADRFPDRVVRIDASGGEDVVAERVRAALDGRFGEASWT